MQMEGLGTIAGSGNKYRFNGKEITEDFGLNWYDYGARWYDATLGRFPSVDPKAAQFSFVSVFNYAENQPISNIDLWGLQKYFAASGEFLLQQNNDKTMRVVNSGSKEDGQVMSCNELQNNSTEVQLATKDNKDASLANWGSKYQGISDKYNTEPGGDREYTMSLFSGDITDENGKKQTVFAEGSTAHGVKGKDRVSLSGSKSPITGWSATETIHTHRGGDNSGEFSDNPGGVDQFIGGDIQSALSTGNALYLVVPRSNTIGSFSPSKYNSVINNTSHEKAVQQATNTNAIKINH